MRSKRKSEEGSEKSSKKSSKSRSNGEAGSSKSSSSAVSISIDTSKAGIQPVLAKFSAAVPPVASTFDTYRCLDSSKKDACIVVSETQKIEYVGQNYEDGKPLFVGSKYLVGVYDKATDTVTFRQAPVVDVKTVIKSLKGVKGVGDRDISDRVLQARNELGEAFGNKKKKAQIRAEVRNKINMDGVKGDMDIIEASIGDRVSSMPSEKELADDANLNRPVPKYNAETKVVSEIYDMEDVLPKANQSQINIIPLLKASDADEYKNSIAARSPFLQKKVEGILNVAKPDIPTLRRALYLGYLLRFYSMPTRAIQKRDTCIQSLGCSPEIADFIYDRFAECTAGAINPDGSPIFVKTAATESRLACHISVLMLALNNWIMYPSEMAADLGIPSKKAEKYLQNVGCKLEAVTADEVAKHTFGKRAKMGSSKKAVLIAPIKFPKPGLRRA
ncbi:DNA-directed RNA polymerase I subunit rpa49 [Coemansia sp. RSA 1722]|nr:DNA-directed RNA polymerase I subunit rpa49 [Coemansia sp. RSA 485]KAJ2599475.1 DNA-directed RNA polymerase I subunit rpa49 [Coemansia sp. RSA 1722]KAJ2602390.1 DNA-directed RNA polymerase I subunit rpa49 [Coemansia sp. RSA 1721]